MNHPPDQRDDHHSVMAKPSPVVAWVWFVVKNLVGWVLILSSFPLGAFVPGPGGIPLFLIGFGLVTFPGKRHITARLLRGIPVPRGSRVYRVVVTVLAFALPALVLLWLTKKQWIDPNLIQRHRRVVVAIYLGVAALLTFVGARSHGLVNKLIASVPVARRKVRPWLRRKGIDLLPPRRRKKIVLQDGHIVREANPEIIEIHERHTTRLRKGWAVSKPWIKRVLGAAITVAIFVWILKPIVRDWDDVSDRVATIRWHRFLLAAAMFGLFLFAFRAMVWRRILKHFGHKLPVPPATRIWSTSELARYLPGVIWQVVGRVYLAKKYGVRGSHCSASQILELVVFLLANMLVALGCLVWLGIKSFHGPARAWLIVAMAVVPSLLVLLHPKFLYPILNGILKRLGKPPVSTRMDFRMLLQLLGWTVLGLLWQSLAIWLLVEEPLGGLQLAKWWVVAGAYCLAWCAGFLAFWAPAGLGVRELVFIGAMNVALPPAVRQRFADDPAQLQGVILFLSVLLRLWTTTGELMLAGVAYGIDWKGALRGPTGATVTPEPPLAASHSSPNAAP